MERWDGGIKEWRNGGMGVKGWGLVTKCIHVCNGGCPAEQNKRGKKNTQEKKKRISKVWSKKV